MSIVPVRSLLNKLVPVRLAFVRSAPVNVVPIRTVLDRLAPTSIAFERSVSSMSLFEKSAPDRSLPDISTSTILALSE